MKKNLILFFISNFIFAQNGLTVPASILFKNDFKKAIIHFNDGTSVEGIGKIKTVFTSREEVIVFKLEENDKDENWNYKDATGITIFDDEDVTKEYDYLKVSKNSFPDLYEVVSSGIVNLYKKKIISDETQPSSGLNFPTYTKNENVTYYLKKESEELPTKIKDNYIKSVSDYFKDCSVLVRKFKNHEYDYSMISDAVNYYNDICAEE